MIKNIRTILGLQTYQPLNLIEISQKNLLHNYKVMSSINKKVRIALVLKSNGYGHGLTLVARVLEECGDCHIPFFCVDSIYEAYELYKASIKTPILIMGYIAPENLKVKHLPFSYAVSTLDLAQAIARYQPQAGVHIFLDTGMHREGVPFSDLPHFLDKLPKDLKVEGLMSHLASGELPNDALTKLQIKNFQIAQEIVKKFGFHPKWTHLSNSGGALNNLNPGCNLARVGLALYGMNILETMHSTAVEHNDNLKPVLEFKTKIIQVKELKAGDRVGYGGTFTAKKPMTIGVLPLGYYDGVDRRLSNKGVVTIDGVECPIIGLVSMNVTTVDLSMVKNPHIGQEVIVYSDNTNNKNSIENASRICKTILYDLLVHLAPSTRRIIV